MLYICKIIRSLKTMTAQTITISSSKKQNSIMKVHRNINSPPWCLTEQHEHRWGKYCAHVEFGTELSRGVFFPTERNFRSSHTQTSGEHISGWIQLNQPSGSHNKPKQSRTKTPKGLHGQRKGQSSLLLDHCELWMTCYSVPPLPIFNLGFMVKQ